MLEQNETLCKKLIELDEKSVKKIKTLKENMELKLEQNKVKYERE